MTRQFSYTAGENVNRFLIPLEQFNSRNLSYRYNSFSLFIFKRMFVTAIIVVAKIWKQYTVINRRINYVTSEPWNICNCSIE